jgi:hypothetical protein
MTFLTPCPHCERHVRSSESACPFCAAPLELSSPTPPVLPQKRLTRAATFAFGAALAVTACGATDDDDDDGTAGKTNTAATGGMSPRGTLSNRWLRRIHRPLRCATAQSRLTSSHPRPPGSPIPSC